MNEEVLTPDVIEELPLEKVIENTLVKNNVTEQVIKALKKQYGGMKLKALDDKQGYLEIKEARNNVRKVGIITEKLCKVGREDAIKIQKLWLSKEKEVLGKIDEVQAPLEAEIKKFDDEESRIKELNIQRQEEQFMQRQTTLLKMEAVYGNNCLALGSVSYEIQNIKEADEEIWTDTILPKYQREFAKVEAEKSEQERLKKEAEDKLKLEQADLLRQQEELKKAQEEMRLQKEALDKQQNEANRVQQEEQNRKTQEALEKRNAITNARIEQLINLGMTYSPQYSAYVYDNGSVNIDVMTELKLWNEQEWNEVIEKITPVIEQRKKDAEEKRLSQIEKEKQEAIAAALKQAEIKKQQADQFKIEEAAKASDKEKWGALVSALNSMSLPEFKSNIYKGKLAILKEKFEEINEL